MGARDEKDLSPEAGDLRRSAVTRRTFLRGTTLTAAAVGVTGGMPGLSGLLAAGSPAAPVLEEGTIETEGDVGELSTPLIAHIKDLSTGEISVFQGEREVVIHDSTLARRLVSSARP